LATTDNIQWKRISAEGTAIVVSILLAFSIQAWWEERQDRENERIILQSILEELTSIEETIPWIDQLAGAIRESAKQLLISAVGSNQPLEPREVDRLLADLTWFIPVTDLDVHELDSLVLSDDLSLIQNIELRRKLKTWTWRNDNLRQRLQHHQEFFDQTFMPFLEKNTSLQQIYHVATQMPGDPDTTFPQHTIELTELANHLHLLGDKVFQNLLTRRIEELTALMEFRSPNYQPELRELIALIGQELEKW